MEIYNKLFKKIQPNDLLLIPNQRLNTFLHKSFASYQASQQQQIWPTLRILQLETWLALEWEKQLIQQAIFPYRLLTHSEEYMLWQFIIENNNNTFLVSEHIAKTAQHAWQTSLQWELDHKISNCTLSNEVLEWQNWAAHFTDITKKLSCIDLAHATTLLMDCFKKKLLTPPSRIFLIGFDEINPQSKKLFRLLEELGSDISYFTPSVTKPLVHRIVLHDTTAELQTMAQWAYQHWKAGKNNIICVVTELLKLRTRILDTFTELFTYLDPSCSDKLPFNVAAGKILSEFSMIQTAITLLHIQPIVNFTVFSKIICSPYIGYAENEKQQRIQLTIYLRQYSNDFLTLAQLAIASQEHCPKIHNFICQLITYVDQKPTQQPLHQWACYFTKKLQIFKWPGEHYLSSEDFQLINRWTKLLDEFSNLDFIWGSVDEATALKILTQLSEEFFFQAKTEHETPIHVLGVLDSAGLCAENLWVMGLDDKAWPSSAQPNPFISFKLQRTQATPHASNEREFYFCSLITRRLINSAKFVTLSHAMYENEQVRKPSTLIESVPTITIDDLELAYYKNPVEVIWETRQWDYHTDEIGPSFSVGELKTVNSDLFKSQAACPFQAFTKFRLKGYFYDLPASGLNHRDRGNILHRVIEIFWRNITCQESLLKQSSTTQSLLIKQTIDKVIDEFSQQRPLIFKQHFIMVERNRLYQRLMELIKLDKNRLPYIQVLHEQTQTLSFSNLPLQLRIDRIDTLSDGSQLIIDYKTGEKEPSLEWFDERLNEPQLPLYCLSLTNVKGCAVIHIASNHVKEKGYIKNEKGFYQPLGNKKNNISSQTWSELINFWRSDLENLANEFKQGIAHVKPKKIETTCRHCHLQLFCRINHDK